MTGGGKGIVRFQTSESIQLMIHVERNASLSGPYFITKQKTLKKLHSKF